jgi:hypothetical protein
MKMRMIALIIIPLAIYLGSYAVMSINGTYRPGTFGTNGIKDWIWSPNGFSDSNNRWRPGFYIFFYPLLVADVQLWHNDWTGLSGPRSIPVVNK